MDNKPNMNPTKLPTKLNENLTWSPQYRPANAHKPFSSHSFSATATAKVNTIDNQPLIHQNPRNNRQITGKPVPQKI
jgi:hypothetical protein